MNEKNELVYALGVVMGEISAARCALEEVRVHEEDEKTFGFIRKDVNYALTPLIKEILPQLVEEKTLEAFYKGLTRVLVSTKTALSKIAGILPDLPGNPQFREVWKFSREEIQSGSVFEDRLGEKYLRAENEAAKIIIRCIINHLRQLPQRANYQNSPKKV